jgi:hypothetical protein
MRKFQYRFELNTGKPFCYAEETVLRKKLTISAVKGRDSSR